MRTRDDRWANVHLAGDANPPVELGVRRVAPRRAPSDPRPVRRLLERLFG